MRRKTWGKIAIVACVGASLGGDMMAGAVVDLPKIEPRRPQAYTLPLIDLSQEQLRQYVVERTPGQYLGHPTTVLLADGQTIFCTYPLGHGGPAAVLKKSNDGGRTWSERLPVPENWATATNCPSIHRLQDPQGVERLLVLEGNGNMRQSVSLDGGTTWTPFTANGLHCTVAPNTLVPISGGRFLAHYAKEYDGPRNIRIYQSITDDGGETWSPDRLIVAVQGAAPDEPGSFQSPDGKRIVSLLRENQRRCNSLFIYSDDEGETWSRPQELPAALTGDRHMPRYAPDGRLVVTFRDMAQESPTRGDWVAWVGRCEDIVAGREGQYRIRLLENHRDSDCAYPGLELLPDGTFVATTYGHWTPDEKPYVVSVRFTLEEIDSKAAALATKTHDANRLDLVAVRRIWNAAPHNAFTDLERFQDRWYCAFREGQGHAGAGDYGKIRIIASTDGLAWESAALLEAAGVDLRDAKLSITPSGQLLVNSCIYRVDDDEGSVRNNQSVTYLTSDGKTWEGPFEIADPGYWLWQTTWHKEVGYSLGYRWGDNDATRLYSTIDGKSFDLLLDHPRPPGDRSNEHALVFAPDGTAQLLLRRDNSEDVSAGHALLGIATAPYRDWEWRKLNIAIGGPSLTRLPNGRLLACVRRYADEQPGNWGSQWTELGWIDAERGSYEPALTLPSGGDSSYAGLVWHNGLLWVSYYSSHEGKTSIYLAQIKVPGGDPAHEAVALGSRRELFVDRHLIERLDGAELVLHHPLSAGTAVAFDQPWEGPFCGYPTVIQDGEHYHLYYRGMPEPKHGLDTEVTCYASSTDGIHWTKPNLSLYEFRGHRENNIILARSPACTNFAPFLDKNPACLPAERFKALGGDDHSGLLAFVSADGVHWKPWQADPVFSDPFPNGWAFDSQNVCFWSETEQRYVLYYRRFIDDLRTIYRVTSFDLKHWSDPVDTRANLPGEHLYTNQTHPYVRAPHIYLSFPKRFFPGKVAIDEEVAKQLVVNEGYRRDTADAVFLTSRGGLHYDRTFREGYVRPGSSPRDWISRSNTPACGLLLSRDPRQMFLYRVSHYGQTTAYLERYALRTDGFASLSAGAAGGELLTRPLTFTGNQLELNFATSAGGSLRVEIQTTDGQVLPGYSLDECVPVVGDQIARVVAWQQGRSLAAFAGRPLRLRIALTDADLFSFRFSP